MSLVSKVSNKLNLYIGAFPSVTGRTSAGKATLRSNSQRDMPGGQVAVLEFTLFKVQKKDGEIIRGPIQVDDVHNLLRNHCKKYTFQLESGDTTGNEHYQGRLSLDKKTASWKQLFPDSGISLRPTVTDNIKGPAFYCMKEQTRVDGPWTEKDFKIPKRKLKCIEKMKEKGLYPWQEEILSHLEEYDARTIHVVIDREGNNGKSWIFKWLIHELEAGFIPASCNSPEDLIAFAMCFPDKKTYVVDMPRAMKKTKLSGFYSAIETIKNGILYDKRYHGKMLLMDEPNILVFTNTPPKKMYLSLDRWKMWTIKNNELVIFKYDEIPQASK